MYLVRELKYWTWLHNKLQIKPSCFISSLIKHCWLLIIHEPPQTHCVKPPKQLEVMLNMVHRGDVKQRSTMMRRIASKWALIICKGKDERHSFPALFLTPIEICNMQEFSYTHTRDYIQNPILLDCFLSTWVIIVLMAAQAHQSICDCGAVAVRHVVNHYKSRLLSACVSLGPTVMCTDTHTHSVYSSLWDRVYSLKQTHNTHTHTHTHF